MRQIHTITVPAASPNLNWIEQVSNLDILSIEEGLFNAHNKAVCAQIEISVLLAKMKFYWDERNLPGNDEIKSYFCKYTSFSDYCKQIWGYAETRCKQFVRIGRTIVDLTHEAESQKKSFILPTSVSEAIILARLSGDCNYRLGAWEDYKHNGVPIPIARNKKLQQTENNLTAQTISITEDVQTIRNIIENLPAGSLAPILASLVTPWIKEELDNLLAVKPSRNDLITMSLRAKHDLANIYHLTNFRGLIGQDLDDFLTEKLNLI